MASVYTNEEALTLEVGADMLLELLDRNKDGVADTGVLDGAIESAGIWVDSMLAQKYGSSNFPTAQITDDPATPGAIQELAKWVTLAHLFGNDEARGQDAARWETKATNWILALNEGRADIPDFPRAAAHEGRYIMVYEAETPTFAGVDDNAVSRTRGI